VPDPRDLQKPRGLWFRLNGLSASFFSCVIYDFVNAREELITLWSRAGAKIAVHAAIENLPQSSAATERRLAKNVVTRDIVGGVED
jgi:hypothetical protein